MLPSSREERAHLAPQWEAGARHIPVVFLEAEPLRGSFFEELTRAAGELWSNLSRKNSSTPPP
jgi:hypothetical protein